MFATERSQEGVQEGLEARRTVVWHDDTLIGREDHLAGLIAASLKVDDARYDGDTSVLKLSVRNTSSASFILQNRSNYTLHERADVFTAPPQSTIHLAVKTINRMDSLAMSFEVLNAVVAPQRHPMWILQATTGTADTSEARAGQ